MDGPLCLSHKERLFLPILSASRRLSQQARAAGGVVAPLVGRSLSPPPRRSVLARTRLSTAYQSHNLWWMHRRWRPVVSFDPPPSRYERGIAVRAAKDPCYACLRLEKGSAKRGDRLTTNSSLVGHRHRRLKEFSGSFQAVVDGRQFRPMARHRGWHGTPPPAIPRSGFGVSTLARPVEAPGAISPLAPG